MGETSEDETPTILMWGDTSTGKTSLIAAALFDHPEQLPLDMEKTGREANAVRLNEHWHDLREGRLRAGTAQPYDLPLYRRDGGRVLLRDIRGSQIDEAGDPAVVGRALASAAAVLFVLDFQAQDPIKPLRAIDGIWNIARDRAKALIFTKCELILEHDHRAWEARRGWWQDFPQFRNLARDIERFEDAVFPTSVYGYHRRSKAPAVTLGEFGEMRPSGVAPKGIVAPFGWALERSAR
jgi:hypothetical protein